MKVPIDVDTLARELHAKCHELNADGKRLCLHGDMQTELVKSCMQSPAMMLFLSTSDPVIVMAQFFMLGMQYHRDGGKLPDEPELTTETVRMTFMGTN